MDASGTPPVIAVVAVPVPPPPPAPPPPPVQAVLREYSWPSASRTSAASFVIASNDGLVRYAVAVWIQDGALMYMDASGSAGRVDIRAVDREATSRLNSERGLSLQIPIR